MRLWRTIISAVAVLASAHPGLAMNYVLIGSSMTGDDTSLDFDSIKPKGRFVVYDEQVVRGHDPRFHLPGNDAKIKLTTIANCDDKSSAMMEFTNFDPEGKLISHRVVPETSLHFAHYADSMDQLLLAIACSRLAETVNIAPKLNLDITPPKAQLPSSTQSSLVRSQAGVSFYKFPDGSEVSDDRSGKGSIMCMWGLDVALLATGTKCSFEEGSPFDEELRASIKQINHFIVENSHRRPTTSAKVASDTENLLNKYENMPGLCGTELIRMYGYMRDRGPEILRASTKELLSIPREPVTNPCF